MTIALLIAAFMMGFLGSPHCLGMCGGIVAAFNLSLQGRVAGKKTLLVTGYHIGRLLSYMLLGLAVGFLGAQVFQGVMHSQAPRIVMGVSLVLVGASMLGLPWLNALERLGLKLWRVLAPLRQKVLPLNTLPKALFAGVLWGFLPCGLVYGALLLAVSSNSTLDAALLMLAFGLGTTPMLLATAGAVSAMQSQIGKYRLRLINGLLLIASGLAIAFVPIAMHAMHGGHGGNHGGHAHHHTPSDAVHQAHTEHEAHTMPHHTDATHEHHGHGENHNHAGHSHADHSGHSYK